MATTAADILVRPVMTGVSGLPQDTYVNDFAFHNLSGDPPSGSEILDLFQAVNDFYNVAGASTNSVSEYIGEAVSRAVTHLMQFFQINIGGSPIHEEPWLGPGAPAVADANMPTEVAGVLSFHGDLTGIPEEVGVTRPKARRRGRVYIGPLISAAVLTADSEPRLQPLFTQTMREAAVALYDNALAAGFEWCVWSRAADTMYPVVGGWTDNAPDTQRRRGSGDTSRITFTTS